MDLRLTPRAQNGIYDGSAEVTEVRVKNDNDLADLLNAISVIARPPFFLGGELALMQEQGTEEEEAAISLGASGLRTFWHVTLPNIKWGLLYGVLLCNARAMGEFGAVAVVSGRIRGLTATMPLHIAPT